jgi:tripartite-type tricarboxylate transporter receptor subunit TctC
MSTGFRIAALMTGMVALAVTDGPAAADPVADFFHNRTITFNVATPAAGGYPTYARVLTKHMEAHIPGSPGITLQFMPGAGGIKAANYLYNVAPRDGSVIGMPLSSVVLYEILKPESVKYNSSKFAWIGIMSSETEVIAVWHTAPAKTLADAKRIPVTIGATAKGALNYMDPALANALLGTKFRVVTGYSGGGGGSSIDLALERGEIHGRMTIWQSWQTTHPAWLAQHKIVPLLQAEPSEKPLPALAGVPRFQGLVKTDEDKKMVGLIRLTAQIGRCVYAPPSLPAVRVAALRKAMTETLADPAFLQEARSLRLAISPGSATRLESAVAELLATPERAVTRFKRAVGFK